MSVAVVADAHLGGPGGPVSGLIPQLRELPERGCTHLVLLGDLFHVWVGSRHYETDEIRAVASVLGELRQRGVFIEYVEGNRDFFIGDGPYADLFDRVASEVRFQVDGRRYLAVHGDGLNDRDYAYRFWSRLSKSGLSRYFMLHLPRSIASWLVTVTERELAKTNFKHKSVIPEAVIRRYAKRRLGIDADVLLMGHFHAARHWSTAQGQILLLDAWFNSRRIEVFGAAGDSA